MKSNKTRDNSNYSQINKEVKQEVKMNRSYFYGNGKIVLGSYDRRLLAAGIGLDSSSSDDDSSLSSSLSLSLSKSSSDSSSSSSSSSEDEPMSSLLEVDDGFIF